MDLLVTDRTFVGTTQQCNGTNIHRVGTELIVDFPEIKPIKTSFRLDAAYAFTKFIDDSENHIYQSGRSHTTLKNRSYQYVGIYALGGKTSSTSNGRLVHNIDANLTAITHIPQAKIIITCRLEMSLLKRYRNLSVQRSGICYNASNTSTVPSEVASMMAMRIPPCFLSHIWILMAIYMSLKRVMQIIPNLMRLL